MQLRVFLWILKAVLIFYFVFGAIISSYVLASEPEARGARATIGWVIGAALWPWVVRRKDLRLMVLKSGRLRKLTKREDQEKMGKQMEDLFVRAEAEGLWFYNRLYGLWLSPKELGETRFKMESARHWELRNPQEFIKILYNKLREAQEEYFKGYNRVIGWKVKVGKSRKFVEEKKEGGRREDGK